MPIKGLKGFIKLESIGGILLLIAAVLAMVFDNTPILHDFYHNLFNIPVGVHIGVSTLSKPLLLWINDGLMALFFLLVGLEVKRELIEGELNTLQKATLPAIAAVGGMLIPAAIYVAFNFNNHAALQGWAIPTATDIAFSLGILAFLRSRIPVSLKIFLTALAIFDDIGAIVIIAAFYTNEVSLSMLFVSAGLTTVLFLLNRYGVSQVGPYAIVGLILWFCVLKSGVHATIAGIILAFAIPLRSQKGQTHYFPARTIEHALHPWVAYCVLPLFAFANAGINFREMSISELISPITLGIIFGLFVGKQIGIWFFSLVAVKLGFAHMPRGVNGLSLYGVALIAGIGFTMSLFIGSLAFGQLAAEYMEEVRLGVIVGSLLSGVTGFIILYFNHPLVKRHG